jgi:hypothetical protein
MRARYRRWCPRADTTPCGRRPAGQASVDLLRQRRRFEALTEPAGLPVAELAVVQHTPVAVPRSAR